MSSTNMPSINKVSYFRPALVLLILLTLITGIAYPLLTTGLAKLLFAQQANGSLAMLGDEVVGSTLLGQNFTQPGYFSGRPSVTADMPYNPMASGAVIWLLVTWHWIRLSVSALNYSVRPTRHKPARCQWTWSPPLAVVWTPVFR